MITPLQRFWLLLKPDNKEIYQVYTYALFKGLIALSMPIGIQYIINLIQGGTVSSSWIVLVIIVTLGIAMGGYLQLLQMRIMEIIQQKIFTRAAFDFTYRLPKIKFNEIYKYYAPELMNRFFEILTIQKSLPKLIIDFSTAFLQILFGLLLLSLYHPFFIFFSVILIFVVLLIIKLTYKRGLQTSLEESKFKYNVVSWLEELARAKDSFKLAGETNLGEIKTDKHVTGYLNSRENHFQVLKIQFKLLILLKVLVALGLLVVGGLLVLDQQMNIGQFVAAEIIILLVIESSEKIIINLSHVFDILTSVEKLGQVTDLQMDNSSVESSMSNEIVSAINVEVIGVNFTYPGGSKAVLKNINYNFKSNGNYCISGKNDSGKSTLVHLISGLYRPQSGNVCINSYPIGNYDINNLYRSLGNGLSEETIFEGTLYENISLGRDFIGTEDVQWAIEKVFLNDYVMGLPNGLDTPIEISGRALSKSITQRIIIARSIVNKPKLLLLESHIDLLDEENRNKIIDFLTDKKNDWTLITISNDPYLKEKCDAIINMSDGEIVA